MLRLNWKADLNFRSTNHMTELELHLKTSKTQNLISSVTRSWLHQRSLSVKSGSYTSWQEFCDRPGTKAPSSDRSLSPGRTSGPASGQS